MKKGKKPNGFDAQYYKSGNYDDWYRKKSYLEIFEKEGKEIAKELARILKPQLSWRFLDIGCGMGGVVLALRKMGCQAFGTEISSFCLKNSPARKWLKRGNALKLPFKDSEFDLVFSRDVLEYLNKKDQQKTIDEIKKRLGSPR